MQRLSFTGIAAATLLSASGALAADKVIYGTNWLAEAERTSQRLRHLA